MPSGRQEAQVREAVLDLLEGDEDLLAVVGQRLLVGGLRLPVVGQVVPPLKSGIADEPGARGPLAAAPVSRLFRSLLLAPAKAVRPIDGKNAALATPIRALAAARLRSAAATSGRRSRSSLGKPVGTFGVAGQAGRPRPEALGVLADEDSQRVLLLGDRAVGGDRAALDGLELGLGLVDVEVAVGAALPQLVDQVQRVLEEGDVARQELALRTSERSVK
jgi:hypothetical protein